MFSLEEMWRLMGPVARGVAVALVGMGVVAVGIALERLYLYLRARSAAGAFRAHLQERLRRGELRAVADEARSYARSPLARVVAAGIAEWEPPTVDDPRDDPEALDAVYRALERTTERELADLRRGLPFLATVASSAPFVGLFGTVAGIITAFRRMAAEGGGLQAVSGGIAEALVTTALGLLVAIVAVWLYNFLATRVERLAADLNERCAELVDRMLKLERARSVERGLDAAEQ